jgi:two-component system phosphate regulon sensor histidine kinase PhoR
MRSLRARIAIAAVLTSALALLAVPLLVWPGLRDRTIEHTRASLIAEARLMSAVVAEVVARQDDPGVIDPLVDEAARGLRARVTVIGLDGRVIAESSLSGDALSSVENHAGRPEVQQALSGQIGSAVRHSQTVDQDMLYVAVPVNHAGRRVGVARVSLPLEGVFAQARDLRRSMAAALLLAFVLTLALSAALSAPLVGPLHEIMEAARRLGAGDLGARIAVKRHDEIGELARILNQAADKLQRRLEESARDRARMEAILATMSEGLLAVDARGIVLVASEALRRSLVTEGPGGRHYLEVVRQAEISEKIEAVLRTGLPQAGEVEVWPVRRVFALTVVPFPASDGTAHGALATFHDITERRRVDQIRRDFVANASHELRTPLTSIRGFVEALEDGAIDDRPTATRFLGKIRTHAERMTALMDDLLELSRLEARKEPPQRETVALADVLDDVAASFKPAAARKNVELDIGPVSSLTAVTDPDRLRRILDCLVENAIKYTPPSGTVHLSARAGPGGGVAVEVRDNGPGIPAEHLPRIFERFYRVDKARSRELGGTGLGLSIAKHLAEGMGASIAAESEVGVGTSFAVTLPPPT